MIARFAHWPCLLLLACSRPDEKGSSRALAAPLAQSSAASAAASAPPAASAAPARP